MRYTSFLILLLVLSLSSCIEDVELYPQEEREVVLSCVLTNSDTQELRLYHSKYLYEDNSPGIWESADIKLYAHTYGFGRDSSLIGTFEHKDGVSWNLDYRPELGCGYSIVANIEGRELYSRTIMPDSVNRHSIRNPTFYSSTDYAFEGRIYLFPQKGISHNYIWVYGTDNQGEVVPEIFTTYPYADSFNKTGKSIMLNSGDMFEPYCYYKYFVRIDTREGGDNPNDKIFYKLGKPKEYKNGILNSLECIISSESEDLEELIVMNVSQEYDQYLKSTVSTSLNNSADFSALFDRASPYSNISNKVGIFGAAFIISNPPDRYSFWTSEVFF